MTALPTVFSITLQPAAAILGPPIPTNSIGSPVRLSAEINPAQCTSALGSFALTNTHFFFTSTIPRKRQVLPWTHGNCKGLHEGTPVLSTSSHFPRLRY